LTRTNNLAVVLLPVPCGGDDGDPPWRRWFDDDPASSLDAK
jgi:hypothetical protein